MATFKEKMGLFDEKVSEFFINAIKENQAPWQKPWRAGEYITDPYNYSSRAIFTGLNSLILSMNQASLLSDDPRWMTFNQASILKMRIKAGEKGTAILRPNIIDGKFNTPKNKDKLDNEDDLAAGGGAGRFVGFCPYYVFHASQIDGMPEYEKTRDSNSHDTQEFEEAGKLLKDSGAVILYDQADKCFYQPSSDTIHSVRKEQFESEGRFYSTLMHELAHWTGHETRLNREFHNAFGSPGYAREELRAEIGSYMVSKKLNLDFEPQQNVAYVKHWISHLDSEPGEVRSAVGDGSKIVDFIVGGKGRQLDDKKEIIKEAVLAIGR